MSRRITYRIEQGEPEFPFDKLRLDEKKDVNFSKFKTAHQGMKIETSPGVREDFYLSFPAMKSHSITYYIDANNNNILKPSLYAHFELHPEWNVDNHKVSPTGRFVEEFWEKLRAAVNRECLKMSEDDRITMMGECKMSTAPDADTEFTVPVANHPEYPPKHPKAGRRDPNRTKVIDMAIWTGDLTKPKADDKKKKFSNVKSSVVPDARATKAQEEQELVIPDTNTILYANIYLLTDEHRKRVGAAKAAEPVKDYSLVRPIIFNAGGHPNANNINADLASEYTILSPSITWGMDKNPGNIKNKIRELRVYRVKERSFNRALTANEIASAKEKVKKNMAELGMSDDDDENGEQDRDADEKEPNFENEFERVNYEAQRDCQRQLRVFDERYATLEQQQANPSLSEMKKRAITKEMSIIEQGRKRKHEEIATLNDELEAMQSEAGDNQEDDDSVDYNDSGCDEPSPKKSKHDNA